MYRRVSPVTFDRGRKNVRTNAFRPYHARRNRKATVLATDFPSSSASGSVPLGRSAECAWGRQNSERVVGHSEVMA
jgi:hypothetical protein